MRRVLPALGFVALTLVLTACHQNGTVFAVDTTLDTVDSNPGDGFCNDANGDCSLRAAVMEANALPGIEEIRLTDGEVYPLTIFGLDEDDARGGDLDVHESIVMSGNATITTGYSQRLIDIHAVGGLVEFVDVDFGPALSAFRARSASTFVTVTGAEFTSLRSHVGEVDGATVLIGSSTIVGSGQDYGSLFQLTGPDGRLSVHNLTISDNAASWFVRDPTMPVSIVQSTLAGSGASIENYQGVPVVIENSILEWGCKGRVSSRGRNITAFRCESQPGEPVPGFDLVPDLGLSELRDHGGPVPTLLPRHDSAVLGLGSSNGCARSPVDARGIARPGSACDLGAVSLESSADCSDRSPGADLRACDLTGEDLSGLSLRNADAMGAALDGADLSDADLTGARLVSATVDGVDFSRAVLPGAQLDGPGAVLFHETTAPGSSIWRLDLSDAAGADLTGAQLDTMVIYGANGAAFDGADLRSIYVDEAKGATFTGATTDYLRVSDSSDADFSGAAMSSGFLAEATDTRLVGTEFDNVQLQNPIRADLSGVRGSVEIRGSLLGAILEGAELAESALGGTSSGEITGSPISLPAGTVLAGGYLLGPRHDISYAVLTNLDLSSASLNTAAARGVDFSDSTAPAHMTFGDFRDGTFDRTDFSEVGASYADFRRGSFLGSVMRDASFLLSSFSDSTLVGVDFTGADLTSARFLDAVMLWNAFDNTICPSGVNSDANGGNCDGQFTYGAPQAPGAPVPEEFAGREAEFATLGGNGPAD